MKQFIGFLLLFAGVIWAEAEPNNSWETANTIGANENITGELSSTDAEDWFSVTLQEAGALTAIVDPTAGLEYRVTILDTDGATNLYGSNPNTTQDSAWRKDLDAGTYFIRMERWSGQGGYTLNTVFEPIGYEDSFESNNSYQQAAPIAADTTVTGYIGYRNHGVIDTEDWFAVTLQEAGAFSAMVDPTADLEFRITILDTDGATNLYGSNPNTTQDSAWRKDLDAGTYFIRIEKWSGQGGYTLNTVFEPIGYEDSFEPNDSFAEAASIAADTTLTGYVGYINHGVYDTEDWFSVTLQEAGALTAIVDPTAGLEYRVTIYDTDGTTSLYYNNPNTTQDSAWIKNLDAGTYFVRILRWTGQGGYTLNTVFEPIGYEDSFEPNDSFAEAAPVLINSEFTGYLGYRKNGVVDADDWYALTVPEHALFVTIAPTAELQARLELVDNTGATTLNAITTNTGKPDTIFKEAIEPGNYLLRVRKWDGQGGYTVKVASSLSIMDTIGGGTPPDTSDTSTTNPPDTTTPALDSTGFVNGEWILAALPDTNSIIWAKVLTADNWIATTNTGSLYLTENKGESWTEKGNVNSTYTMRHAAMNELGHVWMVGESGKVFVSLDTGATWTAQASSSTQHLNKIIFSHGNIGWLLGDWGALRRSADNGETWETIAISSSVNHINAIYFINQTTGILLGHYGEIYKTTNGGDTWTMVQDLAFSNSQRRFAGITHNLQNELFAMMGSTNALYHSTDFGDTWQVLDSVPGVPTWWGVNSVDNAIHISGVNGQIWQFNTEDITWMGDSIADTTFLVRGTEYGPLASIAWGGRGGFWYKGEGSTNPISEFAIAALSHDTAQSHYFANDTLRIAFTKAIHEEYSVCANVDISESNERFGGYSCIPDNMWFTEDSLFIVLEHYSSLGADTGTIVMDFINVQSIDGDLITFSLTYNWDKDSNTSLIAQNATIRPFVQYHANQKQVVAHNLANIEQEQQLQVHNPQGQLLYNAPSHTGIWQNISLPPGAYYFTIKQGAKAHNQVLYVK
jgi:hypothetical protein